MNELVAYAVRLDVTWISSDVILARSISLGACQIFVTQPMCGEVPYVT